MFFLRQGILFLIRNEITGLIVQIKRSPDVMSTGITRILLSLTKRKLGDAVAFCFDLPKFPQEGVAAVSADTVSFVAFRGIASMVFP